MSKAIDLATKKAESLLIFKRDALGKAKAKDKQEKLLSEIVAKLNELFITDELTKIS